MPVRLSSEEEVSSFWINFSNPVTALFEVSETVGCLLVSSAVSMDVDSTVVGSTIDLSPSLDLVDVHV